MLFNSYEFIFLFLPIVFFLFWFSKKFKLKLIILTVASYYFYAFWNPWFIFLMLGSTLLDFWTGKKMFSETEQDRRKVYLLLSMFGNLGSLGFFKYYNFFADSVNTTLAILELPSLIPILNIILPVGISFYTFQSMSYTIDIYRGDAEPTHNFLKFACYVSMFPQLVAGPIVRHSEILYQLDEKLNSYIKKVNYDLIAKGLILFSIGMSKKILIADRLAERINPMFLDYQNLDFIGSWAAMLGYTFQIYFDFSGYSDMAIGLGCLFGFSFPINFNSPYKAENITDFWRRWHISLSTWLKDYLYISLGGNRKGKIRTYVNLAFTMLLGGLWHGASWNYVIWGGIHGALLAIHKMISREHKSISPKDNYLKRFSFFIVIVLTWVFFRCESLDMSLYITQAMIGFKGIYFNANILSIIDVRLIGMLLIAFVIANFFPNSMEIKITYDYKKLAFYSICLVICVLYMTEKMEFLYFQF